MKAKPLEQRPAIRFSARDSAISSILGHGPAVPVLDCESCGPVCATVHELPFESSGQGSRGGDGGCPACGASARPDPGRLILCGDLMRVLTLSARYGKGASPAAQPGFPKVKRWMPISQLVYGPDGASQVLAARSLTKALRDVGAVEYLPDGEPYVNALAHGQVRVETGADGSPATVRAEAAAWEGEDVFRFAVLHAAAPHRDAVLSEAVFLDALAFLSSLWSFSVPRLRNLAGDPEHESAPLTALQRRLNAWRDTATVRLTENLEALTMHLAARNVRKLFDRIVAFEEKAAVHGPGVTVTDRRFVGQCLLTLVQLLAPLAPCIAQELWREAGLEDPVERAPWPVVALGA